MKATITVLAFAFSYTGLCGLVFDRMFKKSDRVKELQYQLDAETTAWLETLQFNEEHA